MLVAVPRTWEHVIDELSRLEPLPSIGPASPGVDAPVVVARAVEFAVILRDGAAPVADRVSAVVGGRLHFEWYGVASLMIIAMDGGEEAEVVSHSPGEGFTADVLHWRSGAAERRPGTMGSLKVGSGAATPLSYCFHRLA